MTERTILVTCGHLSRHIEKYRSMLDERGINTFVPPLSGQQFTAQEMAGYVANAEIAIAGDDPLNSEVLAAGVAGRMKGLVRWGIGTDNVDKTAATKLGIPVFNTPGMFNHEVADLALGHLLNLTRHIHKMDRDVRKGLWTRYEGTSLTGKTVGVVGLGGIGREVARRCVAFGMDVIGSDVVSIPSEMLSSVGVQQVDFETVLAKSDIIILACALTSDNYHLFNSERIARMKFGAIIINVARGPIIEESALVAALQSGQISAAGLDVFEIEPLPSESELRKFDNCLFGTHSGSSTSEAIQQTNLKSLEIAIAMLDDNQESWKSFNRIA